MSVKGTVAITGAGVGLGKAMAVEFATRGYPVLALIFDESQREGLVGDAGELPIRAEVLDVSDLGEFAFPADLEILVNNAGIRLQNLPVEEVPLSEWRNYMEVNFFGAVELTRRAIPIMRAAGRGIIANISSASMTTPIPFLAPYRATKAALDAFSESLRTEVAPFGIRVVVEMPGAVDTGLTASSATEKIAEAAQFEPYGPMARRQREINIADPVVRMDSAAAAQRIVSDFLSEDGRFRYGTSDAVVARIDRWHADADGATAYVDRMSSRPHDPR